MTNFSEPYKGHGKTILLSVAGMILGSIAVLWAWNTLAVDLLGMPRMQFKHGFAVMISMIAPLATLLIFKRIFDQPADQAE